MTTSQGDTTLWIIGSVAWDERVDVPVLPKPGTFAQGRSYASGPGGTAANSAVALASTGLRVGLISYVGNDSYGQKLNEHLIASGIANLRIEKLQGPSIRSLVLVDSSGERTIVGLTEDRLSEMAVPLDGLKPGDVVAFPSWRPHFGGALATAQSKGCSTVVGLRALSDPDCRADLAIGSRHEIGDALPLYQHLDRFTCIVVTDGEKGADVYTLDGRLHVDALPVHNVNATGAGDAFFAGYVAEWVSGKKTLECLRRATEWGAAAVMRQDSLPPAWSDVEAMLSEARGSLTGMDPQGSNGFILGHGS